MYCLREEEKEDPNECRSITPTRLFDHLFAQFVQVTGKYFGINAKQLFSELLSRVDVEHFLSSVACFGIPKRTRRFGVISLNSWRSLPKDENDFVKDTIGVRVSVRIVVDGVA